MPVLHSGVYMFLNDVFILKCSPIVVSHYNSLHSTFGIPDQYSSSKVSVQITRLRARTLYAKPQCVAHVLIVSQYFARPAVLQMPGVGG